MSAVASDKRFVFFMVYLPTLSVAQTIYITEISALHWFTFAVIGLKKIKW
jgi:hypothetical protein